MINLFLCILMVSQINLWQCPLSPNFGYYVTTLVMGAIIDQPQILQYQDVPSLWGRGGGGAGMRAEEMHKP